MSDFWQGRRVTVTGGRGFLGSRVVEIVRGHGADVFDCPSSDYDLTRQSEVARLYRDQRPEVVIHLAARVGGIGANRANPGRFFYENAIMGIEMMEQARLQGVAKYVQVGTVCAYPKFAPIPFSENDLWNGYPEETNAPYGLAKKMLLVQAQAYRQQYGLDAIYLLPVNLYGPRDNFDPESSHVIPALIGRCIEARESGAASITVWGTGTATREFLYVDDCAEAIIRATEVYENTTPLNIGCGRGTSIRELVDHIQKITAYDGRVFWNTSKPDGQMKKILDVSRMKEVLKWEPPTALPAGLQNTIQWYSAHKEEADLRL